MLFATSIAAFSALARWSIGDGDLLSNVLGLTAVVAAALATGYTLHRLLLVRLARAPGPVAILEMSDATNDGENAPLSELTTSLRVHLAEVDLYPQSLVPGATASQDFVQQVQSASTTTDPIDRLVRVLLAALPTHAYRVHCAALHRKDAAEPYGVSVQVQLLPQWMSAPAIHWATSWDEAIRDAAYGVAETILPWTRQGTRLPWTPWLDDEMPPGLLARYENGKRLARERRYDEALGEFREALRLDPANLQLRMELGHLYSKLALWMDALEMFAHVDELAERRLRDLSFADRRRKTRALRRSCRELRIAAQYRRTIALGWGDLLAQQWARGRTAAATKGRAYDKRLVRIRLQRPLIGAISQAADDAKVEQPEGWRESIDYLLRAPAEGLPVPRPRASEDVGDERGAGKEPWRRC